MATLHPDIFTNVHKGIRSALFDACMALGRAGDDPASAARARDLLRAALHFVAHHGDIEDTLLLPLLRERAASICERMELSHAKVNAALEALRTAADVASVEELYLRTSRFTAIYLEHMLEEEQELDPLIRAGVPIDALSSFGRRAIERTSPADQRLMLGWMLPAMTAADVEAFLSKVPEGSREDLRRLSGTR